jgi:hypothetical protein
VVAGIEVENMGELKGIIEKLEESAEEQVSDCATLVMKRIVLWEGKKESGGQCGISLAGLLRKEEKALKERDAERS